MAPAGPRAERPDMAAYGVPNDPEGLLPWSWAEQRLVATHNYWVTTVDPAGRPHSMPVWGLWLRDPDRFVFSCSPESFKARNMSTNPHVVVTGDDTVEVVSVEGRAELCPTTRSMAERYAEKYETDPDKARDLAEFIMDTAMYEVVPTKAFGIIEREPDFATRATRWRWEP